MSGKGRVKAKEKEEIARECIEGEVGISEAARRKGVSGETVRKWIARYEAEGAPGFLAHERNRTYSVERKRQAIEEYLSGAGS